MALQSSLNDFETDFAIAKSTEDEKKAQISNVVDYIFLAPHKEHRKEKKSFEGRMNWREKRERIALLGLNAWSGDTNKLAGGTGLTSRLMLKAPIDMSADACCCAARL
jgi:hypothetical protein